jgi:hypothetical protein
MTIILTPESDPTVRAIATHLYTSLNALSSDTVVQQVYDFDRVAFAEPVDFPVLQLFRLGSRGVFLETTDLAIEYYLSSLEGFAERPGILRLVETGIAHALDSFRHQGQDLALDLNIQTLKAERGYLKIEDAGVIFPYTRLSLEIGEVNVKLPG